MNITYRPYIRDSALRDISIKTPVVDINGYRPKYTQKEIDTEPVKVESQIEEIRTPKPQKPTRSRSSGMKFKSKQEFKDTMIPIYEAILTKRGLNPIFAKALVAQDGLESA